MWRSRFLFSFSFRFVPFRFCFFSDVELAELGVLVRVSGVVLRVHLRLLSERVVGVRLLLRGLPAHEPRLLLAALHSGWCW